MSSIGRRRTYLNYLFENMTFLTIIRRNTSYPSEVLEFTKSSSDTIDINNRIFTATVYSGNLSQYHKFLIFPLAYGSNEIMSDSGNLPSSRMIDTGGYIYLAKSAHINNSSECSGTGSTGSQPYFTISASDSVSKLTISDDSIELTWNITGYLAFNGNTKAELTVLFDITDKSDYAIFGINE